MTLHLVQKSSLIAKKYSRSHKPEKSYHAYVLGRKYSSTVQAAKLFILGIEIDHKGMRIFYLPSYSTFVARKFGRSNMANMKPGRKLSGCSGVDLENRKHFDCPTNGRGSQMTNAQQ